MIFIDLEFARICLESILGNTRYGCAYQTYTQLEKTLEYILVLSLLFVQPSFMVSIFFDFIQWRSFPEGEY